MATIGISEKKRQIVDNLKKQLQAYPIIGLVKIDNIGARIVQQMRKELRTEATIIMAKNSLMKIAVTEVKKEIKGIEKLLDYIVGSCAFLLTKTNPYRLASFMDKNKVPAPAKAGQIAPKDVIIRPMNTGIPPGPVIAELQSLGLKTKIEGGQIRIVEEAIVTKEGDRVNRTVALLLRRLNIDPFEAGLSFVVAFENGVILPGDALIIDFDYYEQNLRWAYNSALNLAVNAGIVTKQSIALIIANANQFAINLSVNSAFITEKTLPMILSTAVQSSMNVAAQIASRKPEALSSVVQDKLKEVPKEPSKVETKVDKEEEKREEQEEPEEDLGLGSLFG